MKIKYKIKVGFFALLMLVTLCFTSRDYLPVLICSVSLHELGHIVMAKICHIQLTELKLGIFGAALSPINTLYSYKKEIMLCLGGPLFNYFTALSAYLFFHDSPSSDLFIMSSLALGTLNLLPIIGFDGGRITLSVLCMILGPRSANKIIKIISFAFIFILWSFSVYLLIKITASLTLFVFSLSLFTKIFIPDAT